jgi:hypothetical protein
MSRRRLRPPSYSNVMSTIAVVVALGTGGAYAANTIGSDDIIDETIVSADVKNQGLKGADILDRSITKHDLAPETVGASRITDGDVGGAELADGSVKGDDVDESSLGNVPSASEAAFATSAGSATQASKAPVQGYQVISRQAPFDNVVRKEQTVDVPCPSGKRPIGGGGMVYGGAYGHPELNEVAIKESRPTGYVYGPDDNRPDSWRVVAEATDRSTFNSTIYITAYAVCAQTDMP